MTITDMHACRGLRSPSWSVQVPEKRAKAWCQDSGDMPHLETSAKADTNVSEAFQAIVSLALSNKRVDEPLFAPAGNLDFSEDAPRASASGCC